MASQELTGSLATGWPGKPHPKQGQIGKIWGGPPFFRVRPLEASGNICPRWMATARYCHLWQSLVQNSDYKLTPILKKMFGSNLLFPVSLVKYENFLLGKRPLP